RVAHPRGSAIKTGEFGNSLDVDVERIEEQPAVGRIGARLFGPIREQGVQRVEPDAGSTDSSGKLDQLRQIGEIAMTPVSPRAHTVKLYRQGPEATAIALEGRHGRR